MYVVVNQILIIIENIHFSHTKYVKKTNLLTQNFELKLVQLRIIQKKIINLKSFSNKMLKGTKVLFVFLMGTLIMCDSY